MIICVCKAVSEKRIHQAVDEGVVSLRDLTRHLGVGTCCGKCVPMAREVLMDRLPTPPLALMGAASQGMPVAA